MRAASRWLRIMWHEERARREVLRRLRRPLTPRAAQSSLDELRELQPRQSGFCQVLPRCGTPFALRCAGCGAELPGGAKFCSSAVPRSSARHPTRRAGARPHHRAPDVATPRRQDPAKRNPPSRASAAVTVLFAT